MSEPEENNSEVQHVDAEVQRIVDRLSKLPIRESKRKHDLFRKLYPWIKSSVEAGTSQRAILRVLKEEGLSLSPTTFKELLASEAVDGNSSAKREGAP